ncbi:MAG: transcription antitermination factor NusB [Cyclobacteriaceae bacterium]|nr:transcription antitermination factor NusB [Cyclobacteriaceae bacterium]
MQSLFAYKQCKEANYHLALEQLQNAFLPDLNSMEVQDKSLLKNQSKEASQLFKKHYKSKEANVFEGTDPKINEEVMDAIKAYYVMLERDKRALKEDMLKGVNQLSEQYVWMLTLLSELVLVAQTEKEKKGTPPYTNFINNQAVKVIESNSELESAKIRSKYKWDTEKEDIRTWLKSIIKPNETFDEYLRLEAPSFNDDRDIIQHLFKSIIFKNDTITDFFELSDLHWSENKPILKSLINKTLKGLEEGSSFDLAELSYNWAEDLEFFETIYNTTLAEEDTYEEMIASKSKNWDVDRIASTDIIMMEMAIQEMIHFPSIPVKVTINEYIEISKRYSTPKSKQFVNGVLDVIAVDLQKQGVIKKSGRGLIDNK